MGLPVNSIIEGTLVGELHSQTIMSVFHYKVFTPSSTTLVTDEIADFLDAWTIGGGGSFYSDYLACLPENYIASFATAQAIHPTRYIRTRINKTGAGLRPEARQANLQASITTQTILAGRPYVGGKRLPISSDDSDGGVITGSLKTALDNFTVDMLVNVTVAIGGGVYEPCIYHRPPSTLAASPITRAFAQTSTRVLRRRTVGLGI